MFTMTKNIKSLVIISLIISSVSLLSACANKTIVKANTVGDEIELNQTSDTGSLLTEKAIESLIGTWQVEFIKTRPVIDRSPAQLIFSNTNRLSGSATCNNISSSYNHNHNKKTLSIGPAAVTRKMCAPALMNQETNYLSALSLVKHYQIKQSMLYLFDEHDVILFKASKVQ